MTQRKMKDSGVAWIGQVPEGWSVERVKYYFEVITGNGFKPELQGLTDGDYPVCKASDIAQCARDLYSSANWITKEIAKIERFNVIPNGSILFPKIGEAMKKNSRAIARVNCCADNNCQGLLAKGIDVEYSYYLFLCIDMNWFDNAGTIPCLNNQKLKGSSIPYPLISEQRKIAAFLDGECGKIDVLCGKVEKQIAALEEYRKSVITEAVTKGIKRGRKMKPSGVEWIGEVPDGWTVTRAKYHIFVKSNLVPPDEYLDFPQISPESIEKGNGHLGKWCTVEEACVESGNHLFGKGQILYSKIRPVLNKVVIAPFDGLCSADMYPIETSEDVKFVLYLMLSDYFVSQVELVTRDRIKMPKINQSELGNVKVVFPSISEQREIAAYLDKKCAAIDSMVAKCREELDRLAEYKKSLIYEYVTGKKEIA